MDKTLGLHKDEEKQNQEEILDQYDQFIEGVARKIVTTVSVMTDRINREQLIEKCINQTYEVIAEKAVNQLELYVNSIRKSGVDVAFSPDCDDFLNEEEDEEKVITSIMEYACNKVIRTARQKVLYDHFD